jgi:hypothetical protein
MEMPHPHPCAVRARTYAHAPEPGLDSLSSQRNGLQTSGALLLTKDDNKDEGHLAGHAATGLEHISFDHNNYVATAVHLGLLLATIKGVWGLFG